MRIIDRAADVWAGPVPRNLSASQLLCFHITAGSGLMCLQNVRSNVLKYVFLFLCNPATVYDAIVILNNYLFYTKFCVTKLLLTLRVVLLRHFLCVQCSCVSVMPIAIQCNAYKCYS